MFSYFFFCNGMKLISQMWFASLFCASPCMLLSSVCFNWLVLLSEKPSSTSRVVGKQIAKTVFKLSTQRQLHYIWCGGGGSKNYKEIKKGGWTNSAFANGGHHRIISYLNPIFKPTLPNNYCTILYNYLHKVLFRSQETKSSFFLIDICFSYENCTNVKC